MTDGTDRWKKAEKSKLRGNSYYLSVSGNKTCPTSSSSFSTVDVRHSNPPISIFSYITHCLPFSSPMAMTDSPSSPYQLRNRPHPPTGRKGVKKLPSAPKPTVAHINKPPTISGGIKKRQKVLGRRPKVNKKVAPSAQVFKVRTYEAEQKAKRLAAVRHQNKANEGQARAEPPPLRRFKRGSNAIYWFI